MERIIYNSLFDALRKPPTSEITPDGRTTLVPDRESFINTLKKTFAGVSFSDPNGREYSLDEITKDDIRLVEHPYLQLAYPEKSKLTAWFNSISSAAWIFDEQDLKDRIRYKTELDRGNYLFQLLLSTTILFCGATVVEKIFLND